MVIIIIGMVFAAKTEEAKEAVKPYLAKLR